MFFKSKKFIIILVLLTLVGAGVFFNNYKKSNKKPDYELVKVKKGDLIQTVEATGKIESVNELSLRFERAGTIDIVNIKEGDEVKKGDTLLSLRSDDLDASVAEARANLNQKLAGGTFEEIKFYKGAVDVAKSALDKAKIDANNAINTAKSNVETSRNNLKLAEGGDDSQIVKQAYEDSASLLFVSLSIFDNTLTQADNILGVDNTLANDDFEDLLSITNPEKLSIAKTYYILAKAEREKAKNKILPITTNSSHFEIDEALLSAEIVSIKLNQLLAGVADVLSATFSGTGLTQAQLDSKKTTIETTRNALSTHYTNIINQKQSIQNAKNSYSTYQIAYNKALRDLDDAYALLKTNISSKEALYNQAVANLEKKVNRPREVDVAYYRAALSKAIIAREKAILKSPIDGIITKINKKEGEFVSSSDIVVELLSPHYEIEIGIPETDVSKLKINDSAVITLDAFGDDIKFLGKIVKIEPASTEVQDVVYYKVRTSLNETKYDIKPGMTSNVSVSTAKLNDVLFIPLRAIRTVDGQKYVRVLINDEVKRKEVVTGLRGDDGLVEIVDGLKEGENVILSIRSSS